MNGFHGQVLTIDDTLHVHQARAVGTGDIFGSRLHVMSDFILSHADGYRLLFDGKHTSKTAALVGMSWFENFDPLHHRQQIAEFIVIRNVALAGR